MELKIRLQQISKNYQNKEVEKKMTGTFWALVPAIVAIVLALCTKEVYSSLFIGIVIGGIFYAIDAASGFTGFITHIFNDGLVSSLTDAGHVGILVFLVILGIMVALMNKAGGSAAFANWAKKHIKTKVGAQCATVILGILIFIDDYFNCLTVGSVMKPVTDKYGVSKEKLAYLIDSTAAPVCIIAPISSWAAAVAGYVTEGENGLLLFCKAIPFNFYALFTLIMLFTMIFMRFEYGEMSKYEKALEIMSDVADKNEENTNGKVIDLVFPVVILILLCVIGLLYSGGYFDSESGNLLRFQSSFADADASLGLMLGSFGALIITIIFYMIRKVLSFKASMLCIPDGFKAMVPAILILTLAWTLNLMTSTLGSEEYVSSILKNAGGLKMFLPAIVFIIACFISFATGTSWGTFGILIPICIAAFPEGAIRIISISACMAGSVCGDHCSPISDTTIMASAGAQCEHVNHVSTQLPYAITVAFVSFFTYLIAGLTMKLGIVACVIISWIFGLSILFGTLLFMKKKFASNKA